MKKALFPGSFDPPTLGHLDIIKRSAPICDQLIIAVALNPEKAKRASFTVDEKKQMLQTMTKGLVYVEVVSFSGLVVDFAKKNQINFLIRGLRTYSDFEYEFKMALANRKVSGIETLFLMASENLGHISSSIIREFAKHQHRLHEFVPSEIEDKIFKRLSQQLF
ncbi:MAG TPA: pantetheine-phosphate adenylyltransferase [Rhabdochlamydiaceae bacterium]|nr:pantetheine-phosphate adenylyltransferase [Rhabdochlamydiaceae bacterium]